MSVGWMVGWLFGNAFVQRFMWPCVLLLKTTPPLLYTYSFLVALQQVTRLYNEIRLSIRRTRFFFTFFCTFFSHLTSAQIFACNIITNSRVAILQTSLSIHPLVRCSATIKTKFAHFCFFFFCNNNQTVVFHRAESV